MSSLRFPWRLFVFLLFASVAALLTYDVYTSGSFKKSQTSKWLDQAGLLVFLEQAWTRICTYTDKAATWLQENVPVYYAKVCAVTGPYLQLFWEKLFALGVWIVEVTKDQRAWLNENVPKLLEWVSVSITTLGVWVMEVSKTQTNWLCENVPKYLEWIDSKIPWFYETVRPYVVLLWEYTVYVSLWCWAHLVYAAQVAGTWLQENVFIGSWSLDNIQLALEDTLVVVQGYTNSAVQWCAQQYLRYSSGTTQAPPEASATAAGAA